MPKVKNSDQLSADNVLEFMAKAVEKYSEQNMIVDAMLWSAVLDIIKTNFVRKSLLDRGV